MNTLFVLAITGPTGSGKSTVGDAVAKQLHHCVNIDADHIKHMIVDGFYEDKNNAGGWSFSQWELVGDSIGLLASNFLKEGYSIIINGYIDEPAWSAIEKHVALEHKILLLPELEKVAERDAGRSDDIKMGSNSVAQHHEHFSNDNYFDDFIKLDTTHQTVDETVAKVLSIVNGSDS